MLKTKPCAVCSSPFHTKGYHKPRKPLLTKSTLKATKPMNKIGKVGKQTNAAMAKFKREQKPNHQGYYTCHYCAQWITYIRAEHTDSRVRSPKDRTNLAKMVIACDPCNEKKGSKSHDEFCLRCVK